MSTFEQIIYRAPSGPKGMILQAAASITDPGARELWLERLDPWLRAGGPQGRGYLNFGAQSVLIRWHDASSSGLAWQFAHVVVGRSDQLNRVYALQVRPLPTKLPVLPQDGRPLQPVNTDRVLLSQREATEARSRSRNAIELLVPMLARVLSGAPSVTMPWAAGGLPEAAVWGLVSLLDMLGDTRPVSFVTYLSGAPADIPGTLVSFRPGAAAPAPTPEFATAAAGLAASYADNPAALGQLLRQHGVSCPADPARIERVLELWPRRSPPAAVGSSVTPPLTVNNADPRSAQRMTTPLNGRPTAPAAGPGRRPGKQVTCPICLTPIDDWDALKRWTWDKGQQSYAELTLPANAGAPLRAHLERGSVKRCPNPYGFKPLEHYLPADYGSYGPPVVLGFVGLTGAGKTHLLTSMVGAMQTGLPRYQVNSRALDRALHERFQQERMQRLLKGNEVLPGTQEGILTFSDAFVINQGTGVERPVIMFDVAGGDLVGTTETQRFLDIADGLFFVVDPTQLDPRNGSDETFDNVLDLLKSAGRLPDRVSAAVVLTKADLIRFDEPATRWLRSDSATVDADEFLRESRDVYAFLNEKGAAAWTLPYDECTKATLHFASSTGGPGLEGGVYPRGVSPRRVLRPLVAMLAMTGVLNSSDAGKVGI